MSIWEAMETLAVARQVVDGLRRHGDHTLPFERCTTCQHSLGALDDRLRVYEAVMGLMSTIAVPTALITHPQPDTRGTPHWCQLPHPQLIDGETIECSCGRRWVWRTVMAAWVGVTPWVTDSANPTVVSPGQSTKNQSSEENK